MKKLFVALMALAVLGVQAFAAPAGLSEKVTRGAKASRHALETKKNQVLSHLKGFRQVTEGRTEFNGSYTMQDMLGLMDSYLELADMNETAALSLNGEINKPIKAGWGSTITIAAFVRDNSHYVMPSPTADDFGRFEEMLGKSVPMAVAVAGATAIAGAAQAAMDREAQILATASSDETRKMAADILFDLKRLHRNWATLTQFGENQIMTMYFEAERIMEAHLKLKEKDPSLAEALCPIVNEPVAAGFGTTSIYSILFNHNVEMNPGSREMQDKTEDYAKWISKSK